jgi:Zn-dependent peptidase ImmA (M78 family)
MRRKGATVQLVVGPEHTSIILADQIRDPGEHRWAVAHELGHYALQHLRPARSAPRSEVAGIVRRHGE